jgi:CBS domain-containing protein
MQVAQLMQTHLRTVQAGQTVGEVIESLAEGHISGLPVVDGHGTLTGVITATDVLEGLAEIHDPEARETFLSATMVNEVMTAPPQSIGPEATVQEAARLMMYLEVHRLMVEDHGRLVGIISTTDLLRALAAERV